MRICTLPSLIRNFSAVKMSSREESKEINKNNFKNAKVKRPLGDLKLNIIHSDVPPGSSKNEICKNEMKSIIKLPNKRPRSANSIGQVEKFNFDILEDKNNENTLKTKKIEGAIKKIGKVNIIHSDVPPGSSKNETDSNEKDKTFKNNLKYLCKKEMKSIIKLPNKRPQSANSIGQVEKFTFDILEDKNNENTLETKKIEGANKKIGKVSVIDKENKPKNVILMENACTERRLIRQRSELEDMVCYRQKLRSEGSLTKSVVDYKPFNDACRKPIRAPVMDNIVRIHTRRVSPIRPNPLSSESVLISKVIGTPMSPRCDEYFPSCDCEFTKDMLQEIIEVGKIQEKKILLSKHFLNLFGHDANDRSKIVNWMLWEQQNCMFLDSDLYIAVSLLDQVLARIAVPRNMYQLVAMACIRLSNKLGEDDIWSPDLLKTPDNIFAETQLSKMEWKLFKLLDFSVHTIEPSVYVNAYLKLANLDPESGKYFKILFCLDHALHESSYSSTPTSLVALAAMSVASKTFKTPDLEKIIKDLKDGLKADEVTLCSTMEKLIVGHIHRLNLSKDSFDILMKYRNCAWNQENQ
ncbi:unnamed protein product [Psylliodes chrysocephalus]|uniref:Cyclin-like domain-containing protein n=1 Tax=Psylliodes chrysocephalus TaxID=3402493 RepID=A0A9P0CCS5_9CUCU|nr:unnamed protein product [Psylliodes chrysocephala]